MADVVGAVGGALGGALAFVLSYFYARTMRVIEGLPEKYMPRADCVQARTDCRHDRDIGREEVLGRLARIEEKVDRVSETVLRNTRTP